MFSANTEVLSPLLGILLPEQKHTHRQRRPFSKGFQHHGGECCHFALHRTMVSAAVIISSTVTNPTSTIAHAENGTNKPSLPLLIKIAREVGVSLDQLVCDSLPIADTYLEKDIADLLADCSVDEKRMIRDIIAATKETLRRHR